MAHDVNLVRRRRVVYVMLADPGDVAPQETFARWPTAGLTASAVATAANGDTVDAVEIIGLASTRVDSTQLMHNGVEWHFVRDTTRRGWNTLRSLRPLRPDVVHLNGISQPVAALFARFTCGRGVRIVAQHHGEPPPTGRHRLLQRLASLVIDAYLFTGGDAHARRWRRAGVISAHHEVYDVLESSSTVHAVPFETAREATGVRGDPAVICVARFIESKDLATVLAAFAMLASVKPGATLTVVASGGDAGVEHATRSSISSSDVLAARVGIVGPIPPSAMDIWLSSADIVLSASQREGSGYALIEAITCGCTPVVSDIAPHRAIAGELGRRFAVADVHAAGTALIEASERLDRAASTAHAADQLSWPSIGASLLRAYRSSVDHDVV